MLTPVLQTLAITTSPICTGAFISTLSSSLTASKTFSFGRGSLDLTGKRLSKTLCTLTVEVHVRTG